MHPKRNVIDANVSYIRVYIHLLISSRASHDGLQSWTGMINERITTRVKSLLRAPHPDRPEHAVPYSSISREMGSLTLFSSSSSRIDITRSIGSIVQTAYRDQAFLNVQSYLLYYVLERWLTGESFVLTPPFDRKRQVSNNLKVYLW